MHLTRLAGGCAVACKAKEGVQKVPRTCVFSIEHGVVSFKGVTQGAAGWWEKIKKYHFLNMFI